MRRIWISLVIWQVGSALHAAELMDITKRRAVTVQGQGKVQAAPDIATLTVEVSQEGAALDSVSAEVRKGMTKVLDALHNAGVSDKDLQTLAFQVQPRYEQDKRGNPHRTGYRVANSVLAKVRDLKKVGKVLSSVIESGATEVNGPNFDFDNPQVLERQALAKAMQDARGKAEVLAETSGSRVGEILSIQQNAGMGWPVPQPKMMRAMAMQADSAEPPIAVGENTFTATVSATFALR
jgi:uncharacterized protein